MACACVVLSLSHKEQQVSTLASKSVQNVWVHARALFERAVARHAHLLPYVHIC